MKNLTKRGLSLLLAALLLLSLAAAASADTTNATGVRLDKSELALVLQGADLPHTQLTAAVAPADYVGEILWSVDAVDDSVCFLSAYRGTDTVTVYGAGPGTATVTVTVYGDRSRGRATYTASCLVKVTGAARAYGGAADAAGGVYTALNSDDDFITTAKVGDQMPMYDVYTALASRFSEIGGNLYAAELEITYVGNAKYGNLYRTSALTGRVDNGWEGPLTDLSQMCFVPSAEGDYVITYAVRDNRWTLGGTVSVYVEMQAKNVSFTVGELDEYRFSEPTRDDVSAERLLSGALGTYGSLRFGEVTAGAAAGTLFRDGVQSMETRVTADTVVPAGKVGQLVFAPSRAGVFRVAYTAYSNADGSGSVIASGAVSIAVGGNSLNLTVNLNDAEPYLFSDVTRRNAQSASVLLREAADGAVGQNAWSYLRFDEVSAESGRVGMLYERSGAAVTISPNTYVPAQRVSDLYFVPIKAGTYEIGYGIYSANNSAGLLATGKLSVVVPSIAYGGLDIAYSVPAEASVSLKEEDFAAWFREKRGSGYTLSHVVFNEYESDFGSFFYDGTRFVPYNSADYYAAAYAEETGVKSRRLELVSFTAPRESGTQAIRFTAYGYAERSTVLSSQEGVLYFFVTAGEVPEAVFNVAGVSSVTLRSDELSAVYRSAMNADGAVPRFYIQLLGVPARGSLYYDSSASGRSDVRLTANSVGSYNFYVNQTGGAGGNTAGHSDVSTLSYVPGNAVSDEPDLVRYVAYSVSGAELYAGVIRFGTGISHIAPGAGAPAYAAVTGGSVQLSEDDFTRWFQSKAGSAAALSHVTFDGYERAGFGGLNYTGTAVNTGSDGYYAAAYAEASGAKSRTLEQLSFVAPRETGVQAVRFTAYGYRDANTKTLSSYSGTLYVFVTAREVPEISVTVSGSDPVNLKNEDVLGACQSVLGSVPASAYYLRFLALPEKGSLSYSGGSGGATRLTAGNVGSYSFYAEDAANNSRFSVSGVSYTPDAALGGDTDRAPYVVYNSAGEEQYLGYISFREMREIRLTTSMDGYSFTGAGFTGSDGKAPRCVSFSSPASGRLYVNYANGRGTEVTETTRFYFDTAAEGDYPITALTYIPRAGATGSVTLDYTGRSQAGGEYRGKLTFTFTGKTASSVFTDVTAADVGNWAANSIDFAYRWGLVRGTNASGGPMTFTPGATMRRCDLVLILYRMAGSPVVTGTISYPDVFITDYYYDSALWASRNELMTGVLKDGRYDPQSAITREDFAAILYNFTRATGGSVTVSGNLSDYRDGTAVSSYALNPVIWAVSQGYITSTSATEKLISPDKTATRAEISTLLHRYLTY